MTLYTGFGAPRFWGIGDGDPSTETHIPLNASKSFTPPEVKYAIAEETTSDKLVPNRVYTSSKEPGDVPLNQWFESPFMALAFFTNKTVGGTWASATTAGEIRGSFSTCDHKDKLWYVRTLKQGCEGQGTDLDELFYEGRPMEYHLIAEKGKLLSETLTVKFLNEHEELHDMNAATAFHDDSWDETGVAEVSTVVALTKAALTGSTYFKIYVADGSGNQKKYYVWLDKAGTDPDPILTTTNDIYYDNQENSDSATRFDDQWTGIECDISGATTAAEVATIIASAIDAITNVGAASGGTATVTITNTQSGRTWHITDGNTGMTVATTTYGALTEGGWNNWDTSGIGGTGQRSVKDCVVHWDDSLLTGLEIETMDLGLIAGYETAQVANSLGHTLAWRTLQNFNLTLTGKFSDLTLFREWKRRYEHKTKKTIKFYIDDTAGELKYFQFTNAYVSNEAPNVDTPESGNPVEATIIFKGGADTAASLYLDYKGNVDPSSLITTS